MYILQYNIHCIFKTFFTVTDNYLIVAEDSTILHMSLTGSDRETLNDDINGRAYGIDYHLV